MVGGQFELLGCEVAEGGVLAVVIAVGKIFVDLAVGSLLVAIFGHFVQEIVAGTDSRLAAPRDYQTRVMP